MFSNNLMFPVILNKILENLCLIWFDMFQRAQCTLLKFLMFFFFYSRIDSLHAYNHFKSVQHEIFCVVSKSEKRRNSNLTISISFDIACTIMSEVTYHIEREDLKTVVSHFVKSIDLIDKIANFYINGL